MHAGKLSFVEKATGLFGGLPRSGASNRANGSTDDVIGYGIKGGRRNPDEVNRINTALKRHSKLFDKITNRYKQAKDDRYEATFELRFNDNVIKG